MTGFEKLTIEQLEKFLERNQKLPLDHLIRDAEFELVRKRIEQKLGITEQKRSYKWD